MKKKRVKIRWEDHNSESAWKSPTPTICTSIGWVTYEDKIRIVLSSSFDGDESYGENMCILKKNIVK